MLLILTIKVTAFLMCLELNSLVFLIGGNILDLATFNSNLSVPPQIPRILILRMVELL